ncbi:hypothetical protein CEE44_01380 [Candidatus Woesearchaeota archaeon B3_Woes]|nr:MAG: hypothetical protein CEE44_01380 [Candidatus Woesearchaeota archaeon B3_Woes]
MKISVDTKEDSHEDIRKIIKMLQNFVGDSAFSNQGSLFNDDPPSLDSSDSSDEGTNAFSAMFGDDSPPLPDVPSNEEIEEEKPKSFKDMQESEIIPY